MGCCSSNISGQTDNKAAKVIEKEKHVTGLTKKQRFLLKSSWKGVSREFEKTCEFLVSECEKDNKMLQIFQHIDRGKLCESFVQLLERIDLVIFHLEDPETVMDLVTNIIPDERYDVSGAVISSELFSKIKQPFLISISNILDERYTQQMEIIYTQFIQFIIDTALSK